MAQMTSQSELEYIEQGVEQNIRGDGRKRHEFRAATVETSVLPQCNGSCRVTLGFAVDLICSVKVKRKFISCIADFSIAQLQLEVTEPSPVHPSEGLLEVSTELSPSLNLKTDKRKLQDEGLALSNIVKG
jgi:exosome complex RNA-binding protein Rrp42 (RNase PH superfamily)